MSNMKNGFSTLNRWLGKKNKDKSIAPNGKLSKSSTNLSISTTNLSDTSQLEYNRIAPLPAVTSNAPFEQTFRITVLLPKDQLYVARLGARVPLTKLLELVCDHKSLDAQKYEFRNPVDPSQIYSCDLTIGSVGLSEIRLCHKSDSYDSYSSDEVIKLHRTSVIRDSLSSSEFSSRNSKHTTKTASPYSSSNSLNSMDSTGMNYTRTPLSPPPALPKTAPPKVAAPPRKKRAAPRPPSQIVIPEKSALVIEQEAEQTEQTIVALRQQQATMGMPTSKDYYVSTPNLSDCNGNTSPNISSDEKSLVIAQKNARNLHGGSVQNLQSTSSPSSPLEEFKKFPEPSPRKRLIQIKKKAAPAPPPRGENDDAISIASTNFSSPDTPNTIDSEKVQYFNDYENNNKAPSPVKREYSSSNTEPLQSSTPVSITKTVEVTETIKVEIPSSIPKPSPRLTTTTLLNASPPPASPTNIISQRANVSKVLLNRTPTPEPRSLSCESPETTCEDDDNMSKQADSGIGEPVPSPIPDSLPSEGSAHEFKSTFESSSDDDEMVKTYNFKLGKTTVKTILEERTPKSLQELQELQLGEVDSVVTPENVTQEPTPNSAETTSWNFSIPISPPPNFADTTAFALEQKPTDEPITPKIVERPVLIFDKVSTAQTSKDITDDCVLKNPTTPRTPLPSPVTPINEIIYELSTILNEKRMDDLIKKHEEQPEIESAKPNTLSNFTITTLTTQQNKKSSPKMDSKRENSTVAVDNQHQTSETTITDSPTDDEKLYKKRAGLTNGNSVQQQIKSINRADSFHTTSTGGINLQRQNSKQNESTNGLNSRSASYLSLTKLDQNGALSRRRSSSELSIGESPSLQSLEVIKTILNSRKNSLATSSDGETKSLVNEPSMQVITIEQKTKTVETKITSAELRPKEVVQVQQTIKREETVKPEEATPKELPKTYRYSGPPSINFSTWSERPKVQVAIKNEGDYIFGGKNAKTQSAAVTNANVEIRKVPTAQRNQRVSMPASTFIEFPKPTAPPVAPKPTAPTERMGIPEKEYHVPVTVKPLKDVTVESVVLRESISTKVSTNAEQEKDTLIAIKCQPTQSANTSTLPRAGNRFSMPAKHIGRSTSITQLDAQQKSSKNIEKETSQTVAPFGQNTLRRTGLKEKILAKEEAAQQQQQQMSNFNVNTEKSPQVSIVNLSSKVNNKTTTQTTTSTTTFTNNNNITEISSTQNGSIFQNSPKTLRSAKLELKLQSTTSNFAQPNGIIRPQSPKVTTPKSAPIVPAPPAPPMPILKSVTLRSKSANAATTPTNGDPRDALLEAIRSFKRNELNSV